MCWLPEVCDVLQVSRRCAELSPTAMPDRLPPWDVMWEYLLDNKVRCPDMLAVHVDVDKE
jgi:hypothetical protein